MNCNEADLLMMKYMDEIISEKEAVELNAHLLCCASCKEAFQVYDSMVIDMESFEEISAPKGFQEQVMAKVNALPELQRGKIYNRGDKVKFGLMCAFAILASIGSLLINNRDAIFESLKNSPTLGEYVPALMPIAKVVNEHIRDILMMTGNVLEGTELILSSMGGLIVLAIVALCAVQVAIIKKKNR